jgi:hypothetical protein
VVVGKTADARTVVKSGALFPVVEIKISNGSGK